MNTAPNGYTFALLGGNCTGWARRVGSVSIEVTNEDLDAQGDPMAADWIAGAHADDGACVFFEGSDTLAHTLALADMLPTDPALFAAFASENPGVQYWPSTADWKP